MKVDGIVTGIQTNYDYNPVNKIKSDAVKQNEASKAEEDAKKKVIEETEKVASEVYGDVLSTSTDGDTTSAAKQSMAALSDGLVMQKSNVAEVTTTLKEPAKTEPVQTTEPAKVQPEENTNPVLEAAKEDAKKARNEEQIDSLTGYTSSQLDSLYAQGKISRIDYDQEISRRDELTKQQNTPAVEEEQEDEDNKENSAAAEQIKQQIEGNGAINNEMAGLVNQQINSDLTGISVDAIQSADGDKINLINQIVNGN